jgi:serine/threonine-protein kinase HipA
MRKCPINYEDIEESEKYSTRGLKRLSPKLDLLHDLPYDQKKQILISKEQIDKISIQGVQPKFSACLNVQKKTFELVDKYGTYIIKPQNPEWAEFPENESFTMHMASIYGISTPVCGLVSCSEGTFSYFIKRFDRFGKQQKRAVEDFSQLAELDRKTKYDYSVEKIVKLIDTYCTFPIIEHSKFFKLLIFNFLFGNEDMHLKNYSIITSDKGAIQFSPAYDLLNSMATYRFYEKAYNDIEQTALTINGKKNNLKKGDFIALAERMELQDKIIEKSFSDLQKCYETALALLDKSFMSAKMIIAYREIIDKHAKILF